MLIEFPIEFLVKGTPLSLQSRRAESRLEWKERIRSASKSAIPDSHLASEDRMAITLYYLPDGPMQGDLDNIIKPILDALSHHIYLDDAQVERVLAQKFEPGNVFDFKQPSFVFATALEETRPILYIRVSSDPFEDLR